MVTQPNPAVIQTEAFNSSDKDHKRHALVLKIHTHIEMKDERELWHFEYGALKCTHMSTIYTATTKY